MMKARGKIRTWDEFASVSKLRKPEWWQSEYGRPFAGWSSRMAKAANAAYEAALGALEKAENVTAGLRSSGASLERGRSQVQITTVALHEVGCARSSF
ncbi:MULTISPECIES: hypothetical protein [unclassified Bradyrhizobium]|uniref:hypothetical protein n=2 Tax=Bradyrhizobium TaxID=374 RepID=UPI002915D69D|nr:MULTISPECIES: hypothetical protein [unclassified Bradyrhizobium]